MSDQCPFPANLIIRTGSSLVFEDNPAYPGDLGALFDVTDS